MTQEEEVSQDRVIAPPTSFPPLSRRNLPRSSHACQRCRIKKAKCDQKEPCSNCIRHSSNCVYGIRRRKRPSNVHNSEISDRSDSNTLPRLPVSTETSSMSHRTSQSVHDASPETTLTPAPNQASVRPGFATHTMPVHEDSDVVGDINHHTSGTEYYGGSSNYVLLNQLFSYARLHLPPGHANASSNTENSYLSPSSIGNNEQSSMDQALGPGQTSVQSGGRVSIINLLSNEEALLPPSRPKTPVHTEGEKGDLRASPNPLGRSDRAGHSCASMAPPSASNRVHSSATSSSPHVSGRSASHIEERLSGVALQNAEKRLEREYVRSFLHNLHYLHPMLDAGEFTARCEEEVWSVSSTYERTKARRHFFALYNIVVAVGALVAGPDISQEFGRELKMFGQHRLISQDPSQQISSQSLSKHYFRKSRALLGDVFEVCSLESAQTLLLMSLYCQNSLKPHACYMYCGMAVRTALAIGLPSESMTSSPEGRKAARRTWWCIYSHEIDMCGSAGRRDSLGKPRNYQLSLPKIKDQHEAPASETEDHNFSMINEMVHFAVILRRISKEIYHDSKGLTMPQKSTVAIQLDSLLEDWKSGLPKWLDLKSLSFRDPEWAAKQKLVLRLRLLNARILLHRPFLAASSSRGQIQTQRHVDLCLDAARETIRLLYDAYANKHYFRTWWYNSTYTLYAGMIVIYVMMLGNTSVPSENLIDDVRKSRDILRSMEEASVARRSADLIGEVSEVALACIQQRQQQQQQQGSRSCSDAPNLLTARPTDSDSQTDANELSFSIDTDFSRTLFSHTGPGQDPSALLASLIDPTVLQDFTAGDNNFGGLDFLSFDFTDGPSLTGGGGGGGGGNTTVFPEGSTPTNWQTLYAEQQQQQMQSLPQ